MRLEGIHHWSVTVTDVARAKRFYGEVLGLREVARPAFGFAGVWYELPNGDQVHLIENPASKALRGSTAIESNETHIAFRTDDWDGAVASLREKGIEVSAREQTMTGWRQAYVCDPDGNVIELNDA